jgi:hypothetical protein
MVPAPTAWTEADAPPLSIRITISMPMELETAQRQLKTTKRTKEVR